MLKCNGNCVGCLSGLGLIPQSCDPFAIIDGCDLFWTGGGDGTGGGGGPDIPLCPMGIPGQGTIDCGSPVPELNPIDMTAPKSIDNKQNLIIVSAIVLGIIFLAK